GRLLRGPSRWPPASALSVVLSSGAGGRTSGPCRSKPRSHHGHGQGLPLYLQRRRLRPSSCAGGRVRAPESAFGGTLGYRASRRWAATARGATRRPRSLGTSSKWQPTADATFKTVLIVGFPPASVRSRRTISGFAPIRLANSAFVSPE